MEKVLESLVEKDEDVEFLKTIPGVGIITASTIRAYTDNINRFDEPKNMQLILGLFHGCKTQMKHSIMGTLPRGVLLKCGQLMSSVFWGVVRNKKITENYRLVIKYRALKQNKGSGACIIATARKMSTIVHRILKTRESFDPSKMVPVKKYINMQAVAFNTAKAG